MLKKERQAFILHQINLHNRVLVADLSQSINVSEDTVRRDLQELTDEGKIIKVHGGALSKSFQHSFNSANIYAIEKKRIIAQKAAALVKNGMFILSSGGTTIVEMIKALPKNLQATFITGSIPAAFEYLQHPTIEIILIGDKLSKSSQITIGNGAVSKIKQIRADICFLGTNGLHPKYGLTDNDWDVVDVKKAMIEAADKLVILTIAEKINTSQPLRICDTNKIDILVTELEPSHDLLADYKTLGILTL